MITKQTLCLRVTAFDHMVTVFTLTLLSQLSMYSVTSFGWFCLFCFKNLSILASDVLFISRLFYKLWYFKIFDQYSVFNVQCFDCFISHQKQQPALSSLITGNTSFIYKRLSSVISKGIRQPPALPCRLQHSTIGRLSLNLRVRDENGCVP